MKIPDHFDAVRLHINDRYATCFLSERTYPLFGAALQPTFKNVSVTFKQDLMSLFRGHALHKVVTCNVWTLLIITSTGNMCVFTQILVLWESKQLNISTIFVPYNLDLRHENNGHKDSRIMKIRQWNKLIEKSNRIRKIITKR